MMAIITAKLAKMRWRNVQFFTVSPRGQIKLRGSIAEGGVSFIRRFAALAPPERKRDGLWIRTFKESPGNVPVAQWQKGAMDWPFLQRRGLAPE